MGEKASASSGFALLILNVMLARRIIPDPRVSPPAPLPIPCGGGSLSEARFEFSAAAGDRLHINRQHGPPNSNRRLVINFAQCRPFSQS